MCGIIFAAFLSLSLFHSFLPFPIPPLSFSRTFSILFLFCILPPLFTSFFCLLLLYFPSHSHILLYIFMLSTFYIFISFSHSTKQSHPKPPATAVTTALLVSTSKLIVQCCNIFWPHSIGIRNLPCLVCN